MMSVLIYCGIGGCGDRCCWGFIVVVLAAAMSADTPINPIKELSGREATTAHNFLKKQEKAYYKLNELSDEKKPVAVVIKNDKGKVIGGMSGYVKWQVLYVKRFYLDKSLRGQRLGLKLLERLIEVAKPHNIKYVMATTLDIGAPAVYRAFGAKACAVLDHAPQNHLCYVFKSAV